MEKTRKITYQHFISHSSIPALHTFQQLYVQETRKMIHEFILYTRNLLHEMESKYCIMGSINQDKQ